VYDNLLLISSSVCWLFLEVEKRIDKLSASFVNQLRAPSSITYEQASTPHVWSTINVGIPEPQRFTIHNVKGVRVDLSPSQKYLDK
jgi:hypothetical protein